MRKSIPFLVGLVLIIGVLAELPGGQSGSKFVSSAQAAGTDANLKYSINLASRQGMMSQKLSKEFLFIALGHDPRGNERTIRFDRETFMQVLKGLRFGDVELELQSINSSETQAHLARVEELWTQFDTVLSLNASAEGVPKTAVATIAELRTLLLEATDQAVESYWKIANESNQTFSLVDYLVKVAGEQRMLTQKMSAEYLMIIYGHDVEANRRKLAQSVARFDKFHNALINGDPDERIIPAPTLQLRYQLRSVSRLWRGFKAKMDAVVRGEKVSRETLSHMASVSVLLLGEMDNVVNMYKAR